MQIDDPEPLIICDQCKVGETDSEATAEAEGWTVERATDPHKHLCPECKDAAVGH